MNRTIGSTIPNWSPPQFQTRNETEQETVFPRRKTLQTYRDELKD